MLRNEASLSSEGWDGEVFPANSRQMILTCSFAICWNSLSGLIVKEYVRVLYLKKKKERK